MVKLKKGFFKLNFKKKSLVMKIIAVVLVLAIVGGVLYFRFGKDDTASAELITATVTRGDITNIVEGTGVIEAINQYEITSLAKGDVVADYFEEGDYVQKDQLLYEIDSSSVSTSIEKAKSNLEKAQMNYDDALESVSDLNVVSDFSGVITELNVKVGDNVSNGMTVAKVVDNENLILNIPFNSEDAANIHSGQTAQISLESSFAAVSGTVTRVATGSVANAYGVSVTTVEISVKNPGSILPGDKATAIVGDYACNDAGSFEYTTEAEVVAKSSGEAVAVPYKEGDRVSAGSTVVQLQSDSAAQSVRSNTLSLKEARLSLQDAQDSLDDYKITAPIAGKVIEKTVKAGEKLDQNSSSTMAIISDLSTLVFEMSIDELDISKIQLGQTVDITADAFEDKTFTGVVSNISIVGTSAQGVTSYPVEVTIDNSEESGLIPGMNVTGDIVVESVSDVLRVPVSAVRRGNFVVVKDDGTVDTSNTMKPGRGENTGEGMPEGEMPEGAPGERPEGMPEGERPEGAPDGMTPPEGGTAPGEAAGGEAQPTSAGKGGAAPEGRERPEGMRKNDTGSIFDFFTDTAYAAPADNGDKTEEERMAARMENMKKQLNVPDGYTIVSVETGLSDDTYIEIKSGLTEGQTVLLPDSTDSAATTQQGMMGGMPGGMGGGMPGGGMGGGPMGGGGMPGGGGGMRR